MIITLNTAELTDYDAICLRALLDANFPLGKVVRLSEIGLGHVAQEASNAYQEAQPEPAEDLSQPEPVEEKKAKRRGRPRKEVADEQANPTPAQDADPAVDSFSAEAGATTASNVEQSSESTDSEFESAISEYRALLKREGATEVQIAGAVANWEEKGPDFIDALLEAIELTKNAGKKEPELKAIPIDDLRNALSHYAGKKGMTDATALLQTFGCRRISELEKVEVGQQHEFMKQAMGV